MDMLAMLAGTRFGRTCAAGVVFVVALGALGTVPGCSDRGRDPMEEGLRLYRQNKLSEALPLLERAAEKRHDAESDALLAETYRRLRKPDLAAKYAREAIDLDPCDSFAHAVLAWNYNPMYGMWPGVNREMSWDHLMLAADCDSTDGNVWTGIWTEAIYRGDRAYQRRALRMMIESGFLTKPLLAYNRWMLRYLPENALLLTNGDWDTYPSVGLQQEEGLRTDVAVVNRSLLNVPWYAMYLKQHYNLPLPYSPEELNALRPETDADGRRIYVADQVFRGWLKRAVAGDFTRPIAISVTVSPADMPSDVGDHLVLAGPFWLWRPETGGASRDTTLIAESLAGVDPDDFSGSFVSPRDRSPVRITTSDFLVHNISAAGLKYVQDLIDAKRFSEARKMLSWIENFESKTELGPVSTEEIARLREKSKPAG
jgi:hypothetical protein